MSFKRALDDEITALERDIEADPRLVKLRELKRIRALYGDANGPVAPWVVASPPQPASPAPASSPQNNAEAYAPLFKVDPIPATSTNRTPGRKPSPMRVRALTEAYDLCRGKTEPTRTADIYAHLVAQGIQLAGDDPQNNLSAMLNKSPNFRSHGRKGWTLVQ
jgi:hypothetical protein